MSPTVPPITFRMRAVSSGNRNCSWGSRLNVEALCGQAVYRHFTVPTVILKSNHRSQKWAPICAGLPTLLCPARMPSAARIRLSPSQRAAIAPWFFFITGVGALVWVLIRTAAADEPTVAAKVSHVPVAERKFSDKEIEFFEKRVRPLLVKRCHECHARQGGARRRAAPGFARTTFERRRHGPRDCPGQAKEQLVDWCNQSRRAVSNAAEDQTARRGDRDADQVGRDGSALAAGTTSRTHYLRKAIRPARAKSGALGLAADQRARAAAD